MKVKDVQLNCSSDSNGRTEEGTLIQVRVCIII